jgi:hypothetical protein
MVRVSAFISDVGYFAPWAIPRERFPFVFGKEFIEFFYIFFSLSVGQTILPWNLCAVPIFLAVLVCFVIAIRKGISFSQDTLYLLLLIYLPIIVGLVFRISLPRYFTFIAPVFFILVARGFWLLPKRIMMIGALVILFGWSFGLTNYYNNKEFHFMGNVDPWREVAHFLRENVKENEVLYCLGLGVIPLRHYYNSSMPGLGGEELINNLGSLGESGRERIWLIYTYQEEYENWLKARDMLSRNYSIILEKKWAKDPDFELKKRFFKKNFSPYRIVAELYERKH